MKRYLLVLTDKEHKDLKILAAEKGLTIKKLLLASAFKNRELENTKKENGK